MGDGAAVQAFTTIGRVTSKSAYCVEQEMDFNPYRIDVDCLKEATAAPIKPLLDELRLTRDYGINWGIVLGGPKHRLEQEDIRRIADAMGVLAAFDDRKA